MIGRKFDDNLFVRELSVQLPVLPNEEDSLKRMREALVGRSGNVDIANHPLLLNFPFKDPLLAVSRSVFYLLFERGAVPAP